MAGLNNTRHMQLLHWMWMLPTCDEKDMEGYMSLYLGESRVQSDFAHEFAKRKYEWRERGEQTIRDAEEKARIAAGGDDDGGDDAPAFSRTFTERTLGLALNIDRRLRVFVNRVMAGSVSAKRGVVAGLLLVAVNGVPTAGQPLKDVQKLVQSAERPVKLDFEREPKGNNNDEAEGFVFVERPRK